MGQFNQETFDDFIIENDVIGFFDEPIRLKSGRVSNWYVNWRDVTEDVFLTDRVSDHLLGFADDLGLEPDCFYGVAEGATKLAIMTQYKMARRSGSYSKGSHVLAMGRGKPKEYGVPKDRYFLGQPKGDTLIIEDVTTTGGSLIATLDTLIEIEVPVIAAISLTDRMERCDDTRSVKEKIESRGVAYHAMSSALDLLQKAYNKIRPRRDIARSIEEEFEKYGVERLKIL